MTARITAARLALGGMGWYSCPCWARDEHGQEYLPMPPKKSLR